MEEVKTNCILCQGVTYSNLYDSNSCSLIKCSACGLIRMACLPHEQEKQKINESIYSSTDYRDRYFKDKRFLTRSSRSKLKIIERLKPQKGKILDIGCSYGFFLETAEKRKWDIYGVEINPTSGSYAKNKFGPDHVFVGKLENSRFEKCSFDVITLWDVVEHTDNPVVFLEKIKKFLKTDGIICIQSPNIDSFIARLKRERWNWLTPGDHIYYFTPETLARTVETAGLRVIHSSTWESTRHFIDSLVAFDEHLSWPFELYRRTIVRVIRTFFFFIFMPFQKLLHTRAKGALIFLIAK
ncbi:class I SAM-dependent methyltransferase [Verrucomicrobiota bacterium]